MSATMTPEKARRAGAAETHAPVVTLADGSPACPTCGGRMWDNRAAKRNAKAPDFKCRNRDCDGRLWPGQFTEQVAEQGRAPGDVESTREHAPIRSTLRACYLDATDFVLAEVRPKYDAAGLPCTDATVAAIVATLFIAACKQSSIGGVA